jgi:stearoyl-CoA desaturase (Delta-9 desaturase)
LSSSKVMQSEHASTSQSRIDWIRLCGICSMHLGCVMVFWVGWSYTAILLAVGYYLIRTFGLTAFYHRYFSHRAFKTSRWFQFCGSLLGCLALQKGPMWWAAHHRIHHRESDSQNDVHSPRHGGFFWSHVGWLFMKDCTETKKHLLPDWKKFPELWWLDRHALTIGLLSMLLIYSLGECLWYFLPSLQTNGLMLVGWMFFISTVFLYHVTYSVNSISHLMGSQRFKTSDDSRNNFIVAMFTLGEGWHNNHHHYQSSARQGFKWWEVDMTYYGLWLFSKIGLVWDLRPVPEHVINAESRSLQKRPTHH